MEMVKNEKYDANFAKKMNAATAVSNGLDVLAGVLPEGSSYFMHNGIAYPLHGTTVETENLPTLGKTINVAEFPNSQVPILSALTGNYIDFPVEEAQSGPGITAGKIAMYGLTALVTAAAALAAAPGIAHAADSATDTITLNPSTGTVPLGYVLNHLDMLPNNKDISGTQGKAYLIDFRPEQGMPTTTASKVIVYNAQTKAILEAVFGGDFEKRVNGAMGDTELGKAQLKLKRFDGDYLLITLTPQYNKDPSQPVRTTQCDTNNKEACIGVEENNGYELPETRGTEIICQMDLDQNVCDIVSSLTINGKKKDVYQKDAAAGIIDLLGGYFQDFEVVETRYTPETPAKEKSGLKAKPLERTLEIPETPRPTINSKLKITISDKGGNPLTDSNNDGMLDTRLGNPYGITLEYSGASEGSQTAKVTVEYTPLKIIPKGATAPVSVATPFEERNIETALTKALSSMTLSATSTIATGTTPVDFAKFATSTAFPNVGLYRIKAEVGEATSTVDVYFPAFAAKDNYKDVVTALAAVGIIAVVLKDKDEDTPASQTGTTPENPPENPIVPDPTPTNPDPDTQLLGWETTHTINVR